MPTLMAMILASVGPILLHKIIPEATPLFVKLFLDFVLGILVFYIVLRILTNMRPDA